MRKLNWLHISDYHCGEIGRSYDRERTIAKLIIDIKKMIEKVGKIDLIFFTGDLVWNGKEKDFNRATQFLDSLLEVTNLTKDRFFIVPGNHDIDYDLTRLTDESRQITDNLIKKSGVPLKTFLESITDFLRSDTSDKQKVFSKFYNFFSFSNKYLDIQLDYNKYFYWKELKINDVEIHIACLNSAWMSPYHYNKNKLTKEDCGNMIIGEPQLEVAMPNTLLKSNKIIIVLMHHPLSWLFPDYLYEISSQFELKCDFLLHGHILEQSTNQISTPEGNMVIIPAGACYNETGYQNTYNVVSIYPDEKKGTIYFRKFESRKLMQWIPETELYNEAPEGEYQFLFRMNRSQRNSDNEEDIYSKFGMLEQNYFRSLALECSKLPLNIIEPQIISKYATIKTDMLLSDIFIGLDVIKINTIKPGGIRKEPFLSVISQPQNQYSIILGDAGIGKSTLVNFITYSLSNFFSNDDEKEVQKVRFELRENGWHDNVIRPFRIILSEFEKMINAGNDSQGSSTLVWQFIKNQIASISYNEGEINIEEYFKELFMILQKKGGLVIFDGLDEVPKNKLEKVKEAIEVFSSLLRKVKIIVTCRKYAYENRIYHLSIKFNCFELCDFNLDQVNKFIQKWYKIVSRIGDKSEEWKQAKEHNLLKATKRPSLINITKRPLLLTLIAAINSLDINDIPSNRAELFRNCIELLLKRWFKPLEKSDKYENSNEVRFSNILKSLENIAYILHNKKEATSIDDSNIIDEKLLLENFKENQIENFRMVLNIIKERSSLLIYTTGGYVFPHRSIQEYLAASYVLHHENYHQKFHSLLSEDLEWWKESFILAVGSLAQISIEQAFSLIDSLCPRDYNSRIISTEKDWSFAILAGEALVENIILNEETLPEFHKAKIERIQNWLTPLIERGELQAVRRSVAGRILGLIGDCRNGIGIINGLPDIVFCKIPEGKFYFGFESECNENPMNTEFLPEYYIAKYEITNLQYDTFLNANDGYQKNENWSNDGLLWRGSRTSSDKVEGDFSLPNHPRVLISWFEAEAFCNWFTKRVIGCNENCYINLYDSFSKQISRVKIPPDYCFRLPTGAEFEKAARGNDRRIYPWGNSIQTEHANYKETGIGKTCAVGLFPKGESVYGVHDICGNVFEWCSDEWKEQGDKETHRTVRGGGYTSLSDDLTCSYKRKHRQDTYHTDDGFRIVLGKVL